MRTNFLVHWTGRDISTNRNLITENQRDEYVKRLVDIINNGFWMTQPLEKIFGLNGSWIEYSAHVTCFTEIRLTEAETHTSRYGLLGVGVNRHFVLERFGGPVHYVRNHCSECVVGNAQEIFSVLDKHSDQDIKNYFGINTAFIKAMSDKNTDNFLYLNEQEWRIVQTDVQLKTSNIVKTESHCPAYRVPLSPGDIKVLVFPDSRTRTLAVNRLNNFLSENENFNLALLTIEECSEF